NRWIYETQCNVLGWMLAYLNPEKMSGKLIQRAVDTFRNLQPGSKSRRVALQEKVLNGTLRK
ncbi:5739_t:CDS:1, partial [Ambispora gerdemannii]